LSRSKLARQKKKKVKDGRGRSPQAEHNMRKHSLEIQKKSSEEKKIRANWKQQKEGRTYKQTGHLKGSGEILNEPGKRRPLLNTDQEGKRGKLHQSGDPWR